MKANLLCLLATLSVVLNVGTAHSKECRGVAFPEETRSEHGALKLNGLGLRQATIFRVDVYVGALYVTEKSADPSAILASNAPKQLILHFVRNVGRSDLNKGWQDGFEKNAGSELPALKDRIEAFKGLMVDLKTDQRLRLIHKPGTGVEVQIDNTLKGTIKGDDFARALFAIWLGSDPPNAGLKAGLLGGACD